MKQQYNNGTYNSDRRTPDTAEMSVVMGLYVSGTVIERTRRMVPHDKPTTEIITYTLETNDNRKYYVDDYAPDSYHERGDFIDVPVYVKPYRKRNDDLSYTLCILRERHRTQGEPF